MLTKRIVAASIAVMLACGFSACGEQEKTLEKESTVKESSLVSETVSPMPGSVLETSPSPSPKASPTASPAESTASSTGETLLRIDVGGQVFYGEFQSTEAAKALKEMLPMTLEMTDQEGMSKRFELPSVLTQTEEEYPSVQEGDVLLEGSGTLCFFYQEDSQGGSYTPIATVREPEGLSQALAGERVEVSFQVVTE